VTTLRKSLPILPAAVMLIALSGCMRVDTTSTVDIVSYSNTQGLVCTSLVVTTADKRYETESSTDCELSNPELKPVATARAPLTDPHPDTKWEWAALATTTDANGRACTLTLTLLGTNAVDETSLDCDYPPEGTHPGPATRSSVPDPDPESDRSRIEAVTFADAHGRTCVMTSAYAGHILADFQSGGVELAVDCVYTAGKPPQEPTESFLPQ
jgi:hypothetical protein